MAEISLFLQSGKYNYPEFKLYSYNYILDLLTEHHEHLINIYIHDIVAINIVNGVFSVPNVFSWRRNVSEGKKKGSR